MIAPLQYTYDMTNDILTIEGLEFTGEFFRELAGTLAPAGTLFQVVKRENGVKAIERVTK
jgi:hypothetical protein